MGRGFGRNNSNLPVIWGGRTNERERFLFIAAGGICFSLFLVLVFVLNFQQKDAVAGADKTSDSTLSNPGMIAVLTPGRPVKVGDPLANIEFKEMYWPRAQVPEGAIRTVSEVQGYFAKVAIQPGIPLQKSHMTKETGQISLPVTPGNRAVAIEVDETSGIEGHALPGTHVDVALTYYEGEALTSKIIVQNARIISAGGDTRAAGDLPARTTQAPRRSSRTITLDVSVKDALEIQTARQLGRLNLLMRAVDDDKGTSTLEVDRNDIAGNKSKTTNAKKSGCKNGRMRSGGKEYIVDCDGTMTEVSNPDEP